MLLVFQRKRSIAVATLLILVAGAAAGAWRFRQARGALVSDLALSAERCASAFSPQELVSLQGTASDEALPAYSEVKQRLVQWRRLLPSARAIYLLRTVGPSARALILADSADRGSVKPGTEYPADRTSNALPTVAASGRAATEGPVWHNGESWVTGYARIGVPLPDGGADVIAVDLDDAQWRRTLFSAGLGTAVYVWMLLVLPLAVLVSAQRQLLQRDALRNLTEAMEQGQSAVMIADLQLCVEYANARFCRLVGFGRRELIGRPWQDFLGAEVSPEAVTDLVTTIRAGKAWTGEWNMPRKNGTSFPVRGGVTPVKNRAGETRSFVGVFEDMTEVRRTEALLREAKERAEAGDRAKGKFLATMSHEVRTPLNGIVGFASLLLETPLTPEQQEYVETIRTSSETLIQLTGDILDYARIESGRLKLEPQPCDPRECIENALDLVASAAASKNIELLHWVEDDVPSAIVADVGRLRQVIVNLVNNAVKFTPGGEVEVRARLVSQSAVAADGGPECLLEFSVRDTGIGIAPEHHVKMFRPFSQADDSTTRRYGGTGLGLAICKNIVELMRGRIQFESEPGRGSTFTFTICVPVAPDQAARPQPPLRGRKLAVAVEGEGLRAELVRLGNRLGADEVMAVRAAELATTSGWDLAIVEISGMEAMQLSTQRDPRPGLPADKMVALVPLLFPGELRSLLRTHFRLLLNKPLHHEMLFTLLAPPVTATSVGRTSSGHPFAAAGDPLGLKVLIVEDNAVNQRLVEKLVSVLGCTFVTCGNGQEALAAIPREAPDVVLMDLHMPEMDGLTATTRIRAGDAGGAMQSVWIIALTADAREEQRERTFAAGANDYLTKPVRLPELTAALQRFVSKRSDV